LRAFLALDFDDAFLDGAEGLGRRLAKEGRLAKARWVARTSMHQTLRFFADLPAELVAPVSSAVLRLGLGEGGSGVAARAAGIVAFPDARRARVLALEVDAPDAVELWRKCEEALVGLGLPAETRPFVPHLTLARLRQPIDARELVAEEAGELDVAGRATSLTLYESVLGRAGPTYTVLARSPA
jgi:2'-5' RNA ligase